MIRNKITSRQVVTLKEPMFWLKEDGTFGNVKTINSRRGFRAVEKDGQCYIAYNPDGGIYIDGLMFAIKEKFDELEGEEINAGGDASVTEE